MRLFELDQPNPLVTKLVAVSDQLKTDIENGDVSPVMTVDQLLNYFRDYDITLDVTDLYDMIKKEPLKKLIANIKGDDVVFRGISEPQLGAQPEQNEKIVQQMAKSAMK